MNEFTPEQTEQFSRAIEKLTEAIQRFVEAFNRAFRPLLSGLCLWYARLADTSDRYGLGWTEHGAGWRARMTSLVNDPIRWARED